MKKIFSIILFAVCVLIGYYVSKELIKNSGEFTPGPEPVPVPVDSDTIKPVPPLPVPVPVDSDTIKPVPPQPVPPQPVPPQPVPKPAHVNISTQEIKKLISNGGYERDSRISKKYKIKYQDVSDDDWDNLQQNFTYIQERINFEAWRDFDVVDMDYDEQGKVNQVTIKPIY